MRLEGAIFDMDGTLLDSMHVWKNYGAEYLKGKGIFPKKSLRERLTPLTLTQAAEVFRSDFGVKDPVNTIERDVNKLVEDEYFHKVLPKDGVPEMLRAFKDAGVKMCIATATDRYLVEAAMERTGLAEFFCGIFTCGEVGSGKTEPEIFERALKLLGTSKERTAVFEDSWYAMETAQNAGFPIVAIYDIHAKKYEELIRGAADVYLEDVCTWRDSIEI